MSFEKVDIESNVTRCESMIANARSGVVALGGYLNSTIHEISKAYTEIDRLTAANADLREQLKVRERDIQLLSTANDDLRRKAMVAEAEPLNPQWTPPKSLKDGVYAWNSQSSSDPAATLHSYDDGINYVRGGAIQSLRDWTDPPREGVWRVTEPGKAVWVRE